MNLPSPISAVQTSRFLQRWLGARPHNTATLSQLTGLSLDQLDFEQLLDEQLQNNASLPAAMRRLRNLLVAAIATRDINGNAQLDEVLGAISGFADFVIKTHLDDL